LHGRLPYRCRRADSTRKPQLIFNRRTQRPAREQSVGGVCV
jgi:hypothetical protein